MDFSQLIDLSNRYRLGDEQSIPRLTIYGRETPSSSNDVEAFIYEPVLCLVIQGCKTTSLRSRTVTLEPGDALLVSHDLPVLSQITRASAKEPYLAIILSLDLQLVRSLYVEIAELPIPEFSMHSLASAPADDAWLAPLTRYLELFDSPLDTRALGPSILREIHYRLLFSSLGAMLRNLLVADSNESRIALAIQKLREEYRMGMGMGIRVKDLAKAAGMSISSFYEHFKAVTGSTPLQYQKDLRLIEARNLLTGMRHTVSDAAYAVGYQSPSHFSRDYREKFGVPPSRDVGALGGNIQ